VVISLKSQRSVAHVRPERNGDLADVCDTHVNTDDFTTKDTKEKHCKPRSTNQMHGTLFGFGMDS
jgi:hypothetical protein